MQLQAKEALKEVEEGTTFPDKCDTTIFLQEEDVYTSIISM